MKHNVLIVEDDHDIAECLQYNLGLADLQTQVVHTVEQALSAILGPASSPAVVLLDPHALDVDANVYARLREETQRRKIPLISLTSFTSNRSQSVRFEIAADYYISKPYSLREISNTIESALSE